MNKLQLITYNPDKFSNYDSNIDIKDFNKLIALDNYEIKLLI